MSTAGQLWARYAGKRMAWFIVGVTLLTTRINLVLEHPKAEVGHINFAYKWYAISLAVMVVGAAISEGMVWFGQGAVRRQTDAPDVHEPNELPTP